MAREPSVHLEPALKQNLCHVSVLEIPWESSRRPPRDAFRTGPNASKSAFMHGPECWSRVQVFFAESSFTTSAMASNDSAGASARDRANGS